MQGALQEKVQVQPAKRRQARMGKGAETPRKVLALCDGEEEYAQLMTEFMRKQKNLPWEIHTYTNAEDLFREENAVDLLVVSESLFDSQMQEFGVGHTVVLNESGTIRWENVPCVDKYQEAAGVLRYLLELYLEISDAPLPRLHKSCKTVFVGNYSPVRRCMQTTFALTMSQLLAQKHPTLYLNFEHYAGIAELLPDMQTYDLADLLYFLNAEKDKFRLRLQAMRKRKGNLDYIPPMKSGQNLLSVTAAEWMELLQKVEELGEYEYVVLDLSESMQGLFEILRVCDRVYTLGCEDRIAKAKLMQYEQVLTLYEYEDVLSKTKKLTLPHIRKLPEELEQLTKGDLAKLVRKLLCEMNAEEEEGEEWSIQS